MSTKMVLKPALGKTRNFACVTGASDGIGLATARKLAQQGFDLVLAARREAKLSQIARELSDRHKVQVEIVAADLGTEAGVKALTTAINKYQPRVAVLAAGFGTSGPLSSTDIETELNMLDVNCRAVLALACVLAKAMCAAGHGQIVLLGSIVGFQGNAWTANYSATKAYVQSLAEGLAAELRPCGVNVLSVAPGPIKSGFASRAVMVMGSAGSPERVAEAIVRAIGTSKTIRPGLLSKVLGYNLALLPRAFRTRIMSGIMAGMTGRNKNRSVQKTAA